MPVRISTDAAGACVATVSGIFHFDVAHELLVASRARWNNGASSLRVVLDNVASIDSGSIATISLLADMAGANFQLHVRHSPDHVSGLFSSGMLERYIPCDRVTTILKAVGRDG